jgi:hypothetical protein
MGSHELHPGRTSSQRWATRKLCPGTDFQRRGQKSACRDKAEAGRLKNHFPYRERCRPQHNSPSCGSTADAKPRWAALYQSLNLILAEDYEYRRLSIWEMSSRRDRLTMMAKYMNSVDLMARERVEPCRQPFQGCVLPAYPPCPSIT